jgi:uncharacterized membrane protein YphA (DoxX/SURF4 family)
MTILIGWLILGLVTALFATGVLLALGSGSAADPSPRTRVMLVFLRLAIGWHFFVEGMDKLHTLTWTSAGYLREATGPLGPKFRELAGDSLVDALSVDDNTKAIPATLEQSWQNYLKAFEAFYVLDSEQSAKARDALDRVKKDTATLLMSTPKEVEKIAPYPPALKVTMTMPQRLAEYRDLQDKADRIEHDELPLYGSEVFPAWKTDLQKDLVVINKEMQRSLRGVLLEILDGKLPAEKAKKVQSAVKKLRDEAAKEIVPRADDWGAIDTIKDKRDDKIIAVYQSNFFPSEANADAQTALIRDNILERRGKDQPSFDPLPIPVTRPVQQWTMLDWSDHIVKYGLAAVGLMLLLGLATRLACVAGAGFLLMFFLAMPPLPGWPESPRVEGHYLFINKNVIEMLALLALATTHSGRWSGLDGLLQFLLPSRWRKQSDAVKME